MRLRKITFSFGIQLQGARKGKTNVYVGLPYREQGMWYMRGWHIFKMWF